MSQPLSLIDEKDARIAIIHMVNVATGLPSKSIFKASDNRGEDKKPDGIYCTFELKEAVPYGGKGITNTPNDDGTLTQSISQSYTQDVKLNFYRPGAYNVANSLMDMNFIPELTSFMVSQKIGMISPPKAKKMPYIIGGKNVERAVSSFTMSFSSNREITVNPIKQVSLSINIEDSENQIDFSVPSVSVEPRNEGMNNE